jgi:hypothetical protein
MHKIIGAFATHVLPRLTGCEPERARYTCRASAHTSTHVTTNQELPGVRTLYTKTTHHKYNILPVLIRLVHKCYDNSRVTTRKLFKPNTFTKSYTSLIPARLVRTLPQVLRSIRIYQESRLFKPKKQSKSYQEDQLFKPKSLTTNNKSC